MARIGENGNSYSVLVGKTEGDRRLRKSNCRWENTVKTDLKGIECEGLDWIYLAQERDKWRAVVSTVMKILIP